MKRREVLVLREEGGIGIEGGIGVLRQLAYLNSGSSRCHGWFVFQPDVCRMVL